MFLSAVDCSERSVKSTEPDFTLDHYRVNYLSFINLLIGFPSQITISIHGHANFFSVFRKIISFYFKILASNLPEAPFQSVSAVIRASISTVQVLLIWAGMIIN